MRNRILPVLSLAVLFGTAAPTTEAFYVPQATICHNGNTISVAIAAVPGHLAHGDTIGTCQSSSSSSSSSSEQSSSSSSGSSEETSSSSSEAASSSSEESSSSSEAASSSEA